jgi:hypothetical protein
MAEAAATKLRAEALAEFLGHWEFLGRAGSSNPIDAAVVLIAGNGDDVITGYPDDLQRLVAAARLSVRIVSASSAR